MTFRKFDLVRDARWVLEKQWLKEDERLIAYAAVRAEQTCVEVSGYRPNGRPSGNVIIRVLRGIGTGIVYGLFFWLIAENYSGQTVNRKAPAVIVWGTAPRPLSLPPKLDVFDHGIWVLTDKRIAFLQIDQASEAVHSKQENTLKPVPVELVSIMEHGAVTYKGKIERTQHTRIRKRLKWKEEFYRSELNDGSGVDILVRRPHQSYYGDN